MRRILTGDLSNEVSVSYKESPEESFRNLSYPKTVKRPAPTDAMPSISLFGNPSILPKPPKLLKGGTNSITSLTQQSSPWPEKQNNSMSEFIGHSSFLPISPRKPGRPSTAGNFVTGAFVLVWYKDLQLHGVPEKMSVYHKGTHG